MNITKVDILERKLKTPEEIRKILDGPRLSGHKSAVLGGCFDLTHPGHLDLISRVMDYEDSIRDKDNYDERYIIDTVIIALNSDISVKILKGENRPIINQSDRAFFLASLEYVDYVTIFEEPIIDDVLKTIKPDFFIKGDQYSYETLTENERTIFRDYNITPLFLPFYNTYSTTHLINQMEANLKGMNCICADRLSKVKEKT